MWHYSNELGTDYYGEGDLQERSILVFDTINFTYKGTNIHYFIFNWSRAVDCELGCNFFRLSTPPLGPLNHKRQNMKYF